MAAGKPIATMINGIGNDVVREAGCGMTANAGDASQLAENVIKLKAMPREELKQMGEKGFQYYQKHFQKDKVISRIIDNL